MQRLAISLFAMALVSGCSIAKNGGRASVSAKAVFAAVETEPVQSALDAADDPAIWVHPTDPARSLVIGTDKKAGLDVYDLSGKRVQSLPDGRMNNVDLRYGFKLGGREVAIVAATNRTDQTLALYAVDANGRLSDVADGKIATGMADPYGLCMYLSASTGDYYVFANEGDTGEFKQWKLRARGDKVGAELVRQFPVGSQAEGCAADDGTGVLYVAEEDVALWRYSAEPDGGAKRTQVDAVKGGNFTDDIEGVAIYYGAGVSGYLIASSQGSNEYNVYRREGNNEYIGKFAIAAEPNGIDGTSDTDGIDVSSAPLGSAFPRGVFIAQDGKNTSPPGAQNFKLVPWERVATALGLPLLR